MWIRESDLPEGMTTDLPVQMMYFLDKWKTGKFEKGGKQVIDSKGKPRVKRMNFYDVEPFYRKQWTFMKRFGASPDQAGRRDVLLSNMYNSCL